MLGKKRSSFAFLVITFNHRDYIVEHLESIKYLVKTYGSDIDVDLIVSDDCSLDNTSLLVDQWCVLNKSLFRSVETIYNKNNLGTCASVANMLSLMAADHCKITAGDDVYSFQNIFEIANYSTNVAILSGRPLYLLGNKLALDAVSNSLATATQVIYEYDSLYHRFKHFSINNAPNILYATDCLLNQGVQEYLRRFDVTEDWPLQVAIARYYPDRKFQLVDQVFVYYRRTLGSTYIVANQRFVRDKIKIYEDLIHHEDSLIEKIRLASRKICFKINNRWLNKLLNIDFYFFALSMAWNMQAIAAQNKLICICVSEHQLHYDKIKEKAAAFLRQLD